jgi:V/A-type H+-transporting ATPase subunit D
MQKISCTRMELRARKAQLELAQQGRDLLEQKRTALMKELFKVADTVLEHTGLLQQTVYQARKALARAEAKAGAETIRSATLASRAELALQVSTTSVMGVTVPKIEQKHVARSILERGYSIVGTSTLIDETAAAFEDEVDAIILLADSELRLTRLAKEIQGTSRRLNALDQLIIPRLKSELNYIQESLDEQERSDHFRLKLVKRVLERRRQTHKSIHEV